MKTKRVLTVVLTVALLFVSLVGGAAFAEDGGIATYSSYTLTVTINTGVASVTVKYGSTTKTFTSTGSLTLSQGTSYTWSAVAQAGYTLNSSSGSGTMYYPTGIGPTATKDTTTYYTLTVTINTGVASIKVTYGSTTKTFTSSGTLSLASGTSVGWTATAKAGYKFTSTAGGGFGIASNTTISPTATVESFTVTATVTPSDATCTLGWTLAWASGKSLTGDVSNYVTMTVASDGKSVTLTFKKNFSAGEMVLTCYVVGNTSVKATCTVTCGS